MLTKNILKVSLLIAGFAAIVSSCDIRNDKVADTAKKDSTKTKVLDSTTVVVIDTLYNFGQVVDGQKVEYNFRFRNTGSKPLVVEDATASCGCTVPEKPDEPIAPGQIGTIKVVFDSKGRAGRATKEITVTSNAVPGTFKMTLTGEVVNKGAN